MIPLSAITGPRLPVQIQSATSAGHLKPLATVNSRPFPGFPDVRRPKSGFHPTGPHRGEQGNLDRLAKPPGSHVVDHIIQPLDLVFCRLIAGVAATDWERLDVPSSKPDPKTRKCSKHDRDRRGARVFRGKSHIRTSKVQTPRQLLVETKSFCTLDFEVTLEPVDDGQHSGMQRAKALGVGHAAVCWIRLGLLTISVSKPPRRLSRFQVQDACP